MKKINLVELLKNCPVGMELDCTMFDNVTFVSVDNEKDTLFPIKVLRQDGCGITLTKYGQYADAEYAKCVIFPKGKTTWEGFQRPFKEGDVVVCKENKKVTQMFILKYRTNYNKGYCYTGYDFTDNKFFEEGDWYFDRLATEEEKEKLFQAIKDNGYKWNNEKKELKKLIIPKFKVGDRVKHEKCYLSGAVTEIDDECYKIKYDSGAVNFANIEFQDDWKLVPIIPIFNVEDKIRRKGDSVLFIITAVDYNHYIMEPINSSVGSNNCKVLEYISFSDQNNYELVPDKFDISTLKTFDKVLVRCNSLEKWHIDFFEIYTERDRYPFTCLHDNRYNQCIPYENNVHLLNTTDDCADFYKTW